ncbi:putative transporter SVOPL isoform X2 [Alosa alosa]|uniref:putative transporter SVOPL isoform X2 n=1 Tax=Alosa alosa TaxID=278164 RepID=UPI002015303D|nr:putative transporter SVOPL isoform X2 [Alosa alosa]
MPPIQALFKRLQSESFPNLVKVVWCKEAISCKPPELTPQNQVKCPIHSFYHPNAPFTHSITPLTFYLRPFCFVFCLCVFAHDCSLVVSNVSLSLSLSLCVCVEVVCGGFVWAAYFSLLTSFSPTYGWFIFLRSLVGCGVAATSQGFVLKTEFIPSKYRSSLLPLASVFWMMGSMLIIVLGMTVVPTLGWRWMIRISIVPSVVLILLFKFIPESARFQVSVGNVAGAMETLQWIARLNGAKLPPGVLREPVVKERGHGSVLVSSTFRRTSVLLWYTWFVASFSYYGSVLGSSELLEKNLLCVTDADPHTHIRHDQQGAPCYCVPLTNDDYITLLFSSLGEVVLIPLNIGLLSVTGRKHSMALVQLLSAAFFMLLNVCSTMFGFTVLLFLLRAVVAMNFNVVYIYTAEVYPTAVRSIGMGVCTSCSRIGGMLAPFIAQVLMSQSVLLAMLPFALACLLSAVGTLLLPIETRGRALLQNS